MLKLKSGDIFTSDMMVLVNTVNCVGVMGKGLALRFKEKYPEMFKQYKQKCENKQLLVGQLDLYYEKGNIKIINFPTKQHWRSPSKIEYIENGLIWFVNHYKQLKISSIAFPALGCGNGGLSWEVVGPLMFKYLQPLPIDIEIYVPNDVEISKINVDSLTVSNQNGNSLFIHPNWLLVLHLIKTLNQSDFSIKVGRTVFQKICYILSRFGTDLNLSFSKGTYGPYSVDVKKMLTALINENLIIEKKYGKMILISVSDQFELDKSSYSKKDKENVNKTYHLFKKMKDTQQTELMTSIVFSYDQLKKEHEHIVEDMIYDYMISWKEKYHNTESEYRIREITKSLSAISIIDVDYAKGIEDTYLF